MNPPTDAADEAPWQTIAREIAAPAADFRREEHPGCDPDPADVRPDANPAAVYIRSLESPAGRASQRQALDALARWITTGRFDDPARPRRRGVRPAGQPAPPARPSPAMALPWWRLRYRHTEQIAAALREATVRGEGGRAAPRFAPATRKRMIAALRCVLRAARRAGLMTLEHQVQACDLDRVRGERAPKGRALEDRDADRLLAAAHTGAPSANARARDAAAVAALLFAGVRRDEAASLRAEKLDLDGAPPKLLVKGKGNRERVVPLPAAAVAPLRAWLAARGLAPGPLLLRVHRSGRIDRGTGGAQPPGMTGAAVFEIVRRVAARAGLEALAPHDCRRTYVSTLLARGADLAVVARLAGHRSVATTQRYDRRGEAAEQAAVRLLDRAAAAAAAPDPADAADVVTKD